MAVLAGFINRRQQDEIAFTREENRILTEMLGGRRLRFPDAQRRCLAELIDPDPATTSAVGHVRRRERLDRLLSFYYRRAG
jgi:hypothetical protein